MINYHPILARRTRIIARTLAAAHNAPSITITAEWSGNEPTFKNVYPTTPSTWPVLGNEQFSLRDAMESLLESVESDCQYTASKESPWSRLEITVYNDGRYRIDESYTEEVRGENGLYCNESVDLNEYDLNEYDEEAA